MKKTYRLMMMLCMACAGMCVVSSCDEDVEDSIDLSGEWEGDMGMYYIDDWGREYNAYNTYIAFYPDYEYATHGYGEEVDYFSRECPIYCQNFYLEWRIRDQVLYLTYPGNHSLDVALNDYRFAKHRTRMYFTIDGVEYRLNKLSDFYADWYWWDHEDRVMRNRDSYYRYMTWADHNLSKSRDGKVLEAEEGSRREVGNPENFRFGRDFSHVKPANADED